MIFNQILCMDNLIIRPNILEIMEMECILMPYKNRNFKSRQAKKF